MTAAYDAWAPFYDATDADRAPFLAFYTALPRPGDRSVVELGCGTGTVPIAVAEAMGAERLAGVDESAGMLEVAASRRPDGTWLRGDMRHPPELGTFDLVLSCFNTLQLVHTDEDLRATLAAAAGLLAPGGRFAFDLYQPNLPYLRIPGVDRSARVATDASGRRLEIREDALLDEESMVLQLTWRLLDDSGDQLAEMSYGLRQWTADDVARALDDTGLEVQERYGDLDRSPFTPDSKKQVYVCGLRATTRS